jgi:hypothetical protein
VLILSVISPNFDPTCQLDASFLQRIDESPAVVIRRNGHITSIMARPRVRLEFAHLAHQSIYADGVATKAVFCACFHV